MESSIVLICVAATVFGVAAQAQSPAVPFPSVTTSGSSQLRVVPDLADLAFTVEVRGPDLAAARKEQAERTAKVLAALRAVGIIEAELQASPVQISADYSDRQQETDTIHFYRISQSIGATLHDLKKVPDVTADVVAAGATGVQGTGFRSSEFRKHQDKARAQAVQAAKEKADLLANALGAKAGVPYTIVEGASGGWQARTANSVNVQTGGEQTDETAASFAPGTISINASVTVTFILNRD